MNTSQKLNIHIHNLLIEKEMNGFKVAELRDALLLYSNGEFKDHNEARKFIYRQILRLQKKKWLISTGNGRHKTYTVTELFKEQCFKKSALENAVFSADNSSFSFSNLSQEKLQSEGELYIILGEVEEYQQLLARFPNEESFLKPMFNNAKERSAKLLGKINALTHVLSKSRVMRPTC